jgi:hypothetical protein
MHFIPDREFQTFDLFLRSKTANKNWTKIADP